MTKTMFTNAKGVSFFHDRKGYWKTTGWFIRPSNKEEYEREKALMEEHHEN